MPAPLHPLLYQINTRVWLTELARPLGRPATLDDIPDQALDQLSDKGFNWVWLLSVWQTGPAAQQVSRTHAGLRLEFQETLPDLREDDIAGSGFAISGYTVHSSLGGDQALVRLRQRLAKRGLRLMLDFVPNHLAPDHPWVEQHPDYFVRGNDDDLAKAPQNYCRLKTSKGWQIFAHGRDPYFDGWSDTLQLNYGNPKLQQAMIGELTRIASQCDGVRCDMAMLVLPKVFQRTWGIPVELFWPKAIGRVREKSPDFCFLAEVYWDMEWTMQQQGFDYTYDKRLYDRLRESRARPVREHFHAGADYQNKLARFLENHDEPRAAATFLPEQHAAAAVITFLAPGMRFFHQGQFEGRRKRISPHLVRAPDEPVDEGLKQFYARLLEVLHHPAVREGQWQLLECVPAWDGNGSNDAFVAFGWQHRDGTQLLVTVNYAAHASQCYVRLPACNPGAHQWKLRDLLGNAEYERDGADLAARGLYLDFGPWRFHAFAVEVMPG